ncbi:hypothetical protein NDU88_002710 [Pleurodeles waltl]|uniref:Uncharacterized protein n=1 Tax=Pleurodeles waltl TaxID=8319 RepID=A0AAV7LEW7_PLEWA|nr:hypothetical protein NDU88_002710 [Pleurodeles waltl]
MWSQPPISWCVESAALQSNNLLRARRGIAWICPPAPRSPIWAIQAQRAFWLGRRESVGFARAASQCRPHLQAGAVHRVQGSRTGASARSLTCSDGSSHVPGGVSVRDRTGTASPSSVSIQAARGSFSARRRIQVGRAPPRLAQPLHGQLLIPWCS